MTSLYRCKFCGEDPGNFKAYVKHLRESHPDLKKSPAPPWCRYCRQGFASEDDFKKHNAKIHAMVDHIVKSPAKKPESDHHQNPKPLQKEGENPKCDACGMVFKSESNLWRHHSKVHAKNYPFKCVRPKCEYGTDSERRLKNHVAAKHPKECDQCEFTSRDADIMKEHHDAVHLGLKNFLCDKCEFKTGHKKALVRHLKRKHGEIVPLKSPKKKKLKLGEAKKELITEDNIKVEVPQVNQDIEQEEPVMDDESTSNGNEIEVSDICEYQMDKEKYHQRVLCIHESKTDKDPLDSTKWPSVEKAIWNSGVQAAVMGSGHAADFLAYDREVGHGHLGVVSDQGLIWWKEKVNELDDVRAWNQFEEEEGIKMKIKICEQAAKLSPQIIVDVMTAMNSGTGIAGGKCKGKSIIAEETEKYLHVSVDKKFKEILKNNDYKFNFLVGFLNFEEI